LRGQTVEPEKVARIGVNKIFEKLALKKVVRMLSGNNNFTGTSTEMRQFVN
jgi:hypothetical protein